MKKTWIARIVLALAVLLAAMGPLSRNSMYVLTVKADVTTMEVSGTVLDQTKDSLLRLRTNNGDMLIKIDANSDTSECKILIPGKTVTAVVYRGDDAYMHAAKLVAESATSAEKKKGESKTARGIVLAGTTETKLVLSADGGDLTLEMDANTNLTELTTVLAIGSHVYVTYNDESKYATKITTDPDADDMSSKVSEQGYIGRVAKDTDDKTLYLQAGENVMEFSIDANTDTSQVRTVVPGVTVGVEWYTGKDNKKHCSMIIGDRRTKNTGTVDGTTLDFSGTVGAESTENVLHLVTEGGTMQIQLDTETNMGGAKIFTLGKAVTVTCGHGSDNYWHAISVSGNYAGTEYTEGAKYGGVIRTGTGTGTAAAAAAAVPTAVIQGQIGDGTTTETIFLNTSGGTMEFKVDATTNMDAARILTTGTNAAVAYYRGSDAYNHASVIVTSVGAPVDTATVDTSNPYTVTGTVNANSTNNMLYLDTPTGTMQIKIDSTTNMSEVKALTSNAAIKVVCCRGSDAYLHATQITKN